MSRPRFRSSHWLVGLVGALLGSPGCTPSQEVCTGDQQARIASFVDGLQAVVEAGAGTMSTDVELPRWSGKGGPAPLDGVLVELDHRGLRLREERIEKWRSSSRLYEELLRVEVLAEATGRTAQPVLIAALAGDASARDAAELLGLARRAGFSRVVFVAEAADGPEIPVIPEPGLPALIREKAGDDPSRKLEVLGQLVEAEAVRCPPLGEPVPHGMGSTAEARALVVLDLTKDALLACHCRANVDRVLSLAHVYIEPTAVTVFSAALSFDRVDPIVAAHADAPWSEVAPVVFDLALETTSEPAPDAQEPEPPARPIEK